VWAAVFSRSMSLAFGSPLPARPRPGADRIRGLRSGRCALGRDVGPSGSRAPGNVQWSGQIFRLLYLLGSGHSSGPMRFEPVAGHGHGGWDSAEFCECVAPQSLRAPRTCRRKARFLCGPGGFAETGGGGVGFQRWGRRTFSCQAAPQRILAPGARRDFCRAPVAVLVTFVGWIGP